jgi:hypothetical protein
MYNEFKWRFDTNTAHFYKNVKDHTVQLKNQNAQWEF